MIGVRLLSRHPEAHQRNDGGCRIRQVIECIRRDGDGMTEQACQSLDREQDQIETDPDDTAEYSICLSNARIFRILVIFNE